MSAHTTMILLVTLIIITVGGVVVFYDITQGMQQAPSQLQQQEERHEDIELVNIIGTNISNDTYKYMRIQVRYDGKDPLLLNDTFIQVRTPTSTADLWYRDGQPVRDTNTGFYTE